MAALTLEQQRDIFHQRRALVRREYLAEVVDVFNPPSTGPGSQLKKLLEEDLGVDPETALPSGCGGTCNAMLANMNLWGVTGSRERLDQIVAHLDGQQGAMRWQAKAKAYFWGAKLRLTTHWFDPANPSLSLALEAIRRVEAEQG